MSNRSKGTRFEKEFCQMLAEHDFWVHNFTQSQEGQPCDVIAVKCGKAFIIDCKVCEHNRFVLSRIEQNQHCAMELWKNLNGTPGWYALRLNNKEVYMIKADIIEILALEKKSLNEDEIKQYSTPLTEWMMRI